MESELKELEEYARRICKPRRRYDIYQRIDYLTERLVELAQEQEKIKNEKLFDMLKTEEFNTFLDYNN